MAAVDCTIDDLLNKLNEWIPIWCGDVAYQSGDTVAIPVEYETIYAICRYSTDGSMQNYGPHTITNSTISMGEQELQYISTSYGCRIYRLVGLFSYTDNFLMLFGKLTPPPSN